MSAANVYGYTTPAQARHLRACMVCSIIQLQSVRLSSLIPLHLPLPLTHSSQKFISSGCPNCEAVLSMSNSPETVGEVTSANFNGMIALTTPDQSWVAKWQRIDGYVPGMYAVQVIGTLPRQYVQDLQEAGVRYVARDGPREEQEGGGED
jgi:transcription elongation factor SPT4